MKRLVHTFRRGCNIRNAIYRMCLTFLRWLKSSIYFVTIWREPFSQKTLQYFAQLYELTVFAFSALVWTLQISDALLCIAVPVVLLSTTPVCSSGVMDCMWTRENRANSYDHEFTVVIYIYNQIRFSRIQSVGSLFTPFKMQFRLSTHSWSQASIHEL